MKNPILRLAILSLLLSAICLASYPTKNKAGNSNSALIMRDPDHFAWEVFCKITEPTTPGSTHPGWESWMSALRLYADPTQFNFGGASASPAKFSKTGQLVFQAEKKPESMKPQVKLRNAQSLNQPGDGDSDDAFTQREDVYLNQSAVRYILDNGLISEERQEKMVKLGKTIDFPTDAIEIKLEWRSFQPRQKRLESQYYCQTDGVGETWGLQSMHITTKDIPNWFWATFEHKDNYTYYNKPDHPLPFPSTDTWGYVNGNETNRLKALLKRHHLEGLPWNNYRLTGSQAEFTDSAGRPIIRGNNAIEGRVNDLAVNKDSSCMTCHSRSTVGGRLDFNMKSDRVGTPNWSWFYTRDEKTWKYKPTNVQRDFVWSLSRAKHRYEKPEGIFWSISSQNPNSKMISYNYDIQPLFLDRDAKYMKKHANIVLGAFNNVRDNFDRIYPHYAHQKAPFMPLGHPKWSDYLLKEFRLWKYQGFQRVPPKPKAKINPATTDPNN